MMDNPNQFSVIYTVCIAVCCFRAFQLSCDDCDSNSSDCITTAISLICQQIIAVFVSTYHTGKDKEQLLIEGWIVHFQKHGNAIRRTERLKMVIRGGIPNEFRGTSLPLFVVIFSSCCQGFLYLLCCLLFL
jgi:hypothetical protein